MERDDIIGRVVKADNPLITMETSGAKGSKQNISEITSFLGQQFIGAKRPAMELTPDPITHQGTRFLPYYEPNDKALRTHGFVDSSFDQGMTPGGFFSHMMSSRVGLIKSAVDTSDTGYIQRVVVKFLEDARIGYDGSICNSMGKIYSMTYGEGFDPSKLITSKSDMTGEIWSPIDMQYFTKRFSD